MAQQTISQLGPLVRLEGISIASLPPGGRGVKPSAQITSTVELSDRAGSAAAPHIKTFITNVLLEAVPFIDGVAAKSGAQEPTWKKKGSPKVYTSSDAPVFLYERTVLGKDLDKIEGMNKFSADRKDETWFCRRSCHKNKRESRTASWEEFTHTFKDHHAKSEDAFTPTVIGARQALKWETDDIEVEVNGESWNNISMVVEEMKHKIDPKPLKNRTFPIVQIAADLAGTQEFIVVSIPLTDFEKSPYAEYAKDKSLVVAAYASIERIRILPTNGDIEWIMGTASDARGVLPQFLQNLAVPSAVAKDVDMFLGWIPSQRGINKPAPLAKSTSADKSLLVGPSGSTRAPISKTDELSTAPDSDKVLPAAPVQ